MRPILLLQQILSKENHSSSTNNRVSRSLLSIPIKLKELQVREGLQQIYVKAVPEVLSNRLRLITQSPKPINAIELSHPILVVMLLLVVEIGISRLSEYSRMEAVEKETEFVLKKQYIATKMSLRIEPTQQPWWLDQNSTNTDTRPTYTTFAS